MPERVLFRAFVAFVTGWWGSHMASKKQLLRFRIELQGIAPSIWREIVVPSSYSFWDLHVAIQDAMGWLDYHLHAFRIRDPETGGAAEIGIPLEDDFDDDLQVIAGWEVPVLSYLNEPGHSAEYEYDFGDCWNHHVLLQEIMDRERGVKYPRCTGGERACPPEDCGGIWGYQALLEVLDDPAHEEHEEMREWVGDRFDPGQFDPDLVKFDNPQKRRRIAFADGE
jgi:Plasmid pRiA4b ORF-3-like protein